MELSELRQRLEVFSAAHYNGPTEITEVVVMPGHAGFAYGFRVRSPAPSCPFEVWGRFGVGPGPM